MVNMPLSLKTFVFSQKKQCITSASNTNNKEALLNQSVNQPCAKKKSYFQRIKVNVCKFIPHNKQNHHHRGPSIIPESGFVTNVTKKIR